MLKEIIAQFLQISEQAAQALLDLLTLEKRWQEAQPLENKVIDPTKIQTQLELIEFLQGVGQSKWFKGHDRSKFPEDMQENAIKETYWNLFENFGMTNACTSDVIPDYSVVLGSSEFQVKLRTQSMIEDIISRGITPTSQTVLGCGGSRELGKSVVTSEEDSINKLKQDGLSTTEMNMVSLIVQEALKQHGLNESLTYIPIDAGGARDRTQANCATTMHNAEGILETIKKLNAANNKLEGVTTITIYSNQPHTARQARDIEEKLRSDPSGALYQVNKVGQAYTKEAFLVNSRSISVFLGEIARLINIMYRRLDPSTANIPLTNEEQQELRALTTNIQIEQRITAEQPITKENFQSVFQLPPEKLPSTVENDQVLLEEKKLSPFTT